MFIKADENAHIWMSIRTVGGWVFSWNLPLKTNRLQSQTLFMGFIFQQEPRLYVWGGEVMSDRSHSWSGATPRFTAYALRAMLSKGQYHSPENELSTVYLTQFVPLDPATGPEYDGSERRASGEQESKINIPVNNNGFTYLKGLWECSSHALGSQSSRNKN